MRSQTVSTQLQEIAEKASQDPTWVCTTLAHRIDVEFLREACVKLNKKGAPGLSKVSAAEYGEPGATRVPGYTVSYKQPAHDHQTFEYMTVALNELANAKKCGRRREDAAAEHKR